MSTIHPDDVPVSIRSLIPVAEEWGIGDDIEREEKVESASDDELRQLVLVLRTVPKDDLFGWLAGPESYSTSPTAAYVAFTCLTMAVDSAAATLKRRSVEPT